MAKKIGRNINTNDTGTISSAITLNATTSTTIQAANSSRIFFRIDNSSTKDVWLKLQAASVDNDKKGIFLKRLGDFWEMPPDNIYTGEISAIAVNDVPEVFATEY